jgi:hypothetical protein
MSRPQFPFVTKGVSALARFLARELGGFDEKPSHVQMLNLLARSAGYRNFQHWRAQHDARERIAQTPVVPEPIDHVRVEQTARHFDRDGLLLRWPSKASHAELCLWATLVAPASGPDAERAGDQRVACRHPRVRRPCAAAARVARPRARVAHQGRRAIPAHRARSAR